MTNGGKTTLTNSLFKALPNCCVIHQDDFFKVAALIWGQEESAQAALSSAAHCGLGTDPSPVRRARDGRSHLLSSYYAPGMLDWH